MRMFIAIALPVDIQRALEQAQQNLRAYAPNARFVPPNNFHMTLHFIGESNDLAGAAKACEEAVRGIRPFELYLSEYGSFARGASRTSLIHVDGDLAELRRLHQTLESALSEQGFKQDRRLSPHITLARNVFHNDQVTKALQDCCEHRSFVVSAITLFESTNVRGRMVYTPLHRAAF